MNLLKKRNLALLLTMSMAFAISCENEQQPLPRADESNETTNKQRSNISGRTGTEGLLWWFFNNTNGIGEATPYGKVASGSTLTVTLNNAVFGSTSGSGTRQMNQSLVVAQTSCDFQSMTVTANGNTISPTTVGGIVYYDYASSYTSYDLSISTNWVVTVSPSNAWVELATQANTPSFPMDGFNPSGSGIYYPSDSNPLATVGGDCGVGRTWSITQPASSVNRLTNYTYTLAANGSCAAANTPVITITNTGVASFKVKYFNGVLVNITLAAFGGSTNFTLPAIAGCTGGTTPSTTYTVQYDQISVSSTIVNSVSVSSPHSVGSSKTQSGPF
jgi:hypothetical protein